MLTAYSTWVAFVSLAALSVSAAMFNPYKEGSYERKSVVVGEGHADGLEPLVSTGRQTGQEPCPKAVMFEQAVVGRAAH